MKIIINNKEATSLPSESTPYIPGSTLKTAIRKIIKDVQTSGDVALQKYTAKFDRVSLSRFGIPQSQFKEALMNISSENRAALELMARNLTQFAQQQMSQLQNFESEIMPGVFCGQRVLPMQRVGIYTPGGRFPLVSSLLMGAIPARVAGVESIIVCTPPSRDGRLHTSMLAAAAIAGVDEFYTIGGVQAIAAMAYGTETIRRVDKIVGPGNQYVTAAKKEVYGDVGIDFIAGPSEVLIIADQQANPNWIAADLLAQAEHDVEAKAILITPSLTLAEQVIVAIDQQLKTLDTAYLAKQALDSNGRIYVVESLAQAVSIANQMAPEHLELHLEDPSLLVAQLKNYGSLFIGSSAAEVFGDYSSGLNHTLPTAGAARYTGGLSVRDFVKISTTLRTTATGNAGIGPAAYTLARLEGLSGHAYATQIRLSQSNPII